MEKGESAEEALSLMHRDMSALIGAHQREKDALLFRIEQLERTLAAKEAALVQLGVVAEGEASERP